MKLSSDDMRTLAAQERDMSAGKVPHVLLNGVRIAMMPEAMKHFELVSGQIINSSIMVAILQFNLDYCRNKIAERKTQEAIENMKRDTCRTNKILGEQ